MGGLYGVRLNHSGAEGAEGEILCRARGIFRLEGITPLVGDSVEISRDTERVLTEEERSAEKEAGVRVDYVIDRILPRSSALIRPPVANLTHLFAVIPAAQPKPDLLTADKLTVIAENYGIEPVIVDPWASSDESKHEYGVELTALSDVKDADCIMVAVAHNEFKALSLDSIKAMFKNCPDEEKVLLDIKGIYKVSDLKDSNMKYWRL